MVNEYKGEWIETYSGGRLHFKNPQSEEIKIVDIAHHLSLICRFTGAVKEFYSVAEHSIRVAEIVPNELKLAALLHDAAEAYIGDISRPVKHTHKLQETENILANAIDKKYGIDSRVPAIRYADDVLIATEARDLMPNTIDWAVLPPPLFKKIHPLSPRVAESLFLACFYACGGKED